MNIQRLESIYELILRVIVMALQKFLVKTTILLVVYLVQLIEHPILRIPNILFVYFLSIFPDKSFKLRYTQKCANITRYNKKNKIKIGLILSSRGYK